MRKLRLNVMAAGIVAIAIIAHKLRPSTWILHFQLWKGGIQLWWIRTTKYYYETKIMLMKIGY